MDDNKRKRVEVEEEDEGYEDDLGNFVDAALLVKPVYTDTDFKQVTLLQHVMNLLPKNYEKLAPEDFQGVGYDKKLGCFKFKITPQYFELISKHAFLVEYVCTRTNCSSRFIYSEEPGVCIGLSIWLNKAVKLSKHYYDKYLYHVYQSRVIKEYPNIDLQNADKIVGVGNSQSGVSRYTSVSKARADHFEFLRGNVTYSSSICECVIGAIYVMNKGKLVFGKEKVEESKLKGVKRGRFQSAKSVTERKEFVDGSVLIDRKYTFADFKNVNTLNDLLKLVPRNVSKLEVEDILGLSLEHNSGQFQFKSLAALGQDFVARHGFVLYFLSPKKYLTIINKDPKICIGMSILVNGGLFYSKSYYDKYLFHIYHTKVIKEYPILKQKPDTFIKKIGKHLTHGSRTDLSKKEVEIGFDFIRGVKAYTSKDRACVIAARYLLNNNKLYF